MLTLGPEGFRSQIPLRSQLPPASPLCYSVLSVDSVLRKNLLSHPNRSASSARTATPATSFLSWVYFTVSCISPRSPSKAGDTTHPSTLDTHRACSNARNPFPLMRLRALPGTDGGAPPPLRKCPAPSYRNSQDAPQVPFSPSTTHYPLLTPACTLYPASVTKPLRSKAPCPMKTS
jgi:hypothetical protein